MFLAKNAFLWKDCAPMKSLFPRLVFFLTFLAPSVQAAPDPAAEIEVYPLEIRQAALEALKYPKVLVGLNESQQRSSAAFASFLGTLSPQVKQDVIRLAPFPNLVHALSELGAKNPKGVQKAMEAFPKSLQPVAQDMMLKHPDVLAALDKLDDEPLKNYGALTQSLPMQAKTAFQKLLRHPDTLKNIALALDLKSVTMADYLKAPQTVDNKAYALAQRLKNAENPPPPKIAAAKGDDPAALEALQKQSDEINNTLNYEMNVDPDPAGAAEASVSFTPYPFYNAGLGGFVMPYWFGFGAWL